MISFKVTLLQRFQGLINTEELTDTVFEMFSGTSNVVNHVQGNNKEYKCRLLPPANTIEDVCNGVSIIIQMQAVKELDDSFELLPKLVISSDADRFCYESVPKLRRRLKRSSKNQIVSALHRFGSVQYLKKVQLLLGNHRNVSLTPS